MRLKKPKSNEKNYLSKIPQSKHNHNKNISMDQITDKNQNNQSVYLNKILLKNLGEQSPDANFPNFQENIENFQSSIQNIFSNEENRQRAMKYVINMRSRRGNLSPYEYNEERNNKNNNNINIKSIIRLKFYSLIYFIIATFISGFHFITWHIIIIIFRSIIKSIIYRFRKNIYIIYINIIIFFISSFIINFKRG